jgi:radical SAM superfamily enzyme YgiQ (UPF0313 family)
MKVTLVQPKYFNIWESIAFGYLGSYVKRYYKGKLDINYFQAFFDDEKNIIEESINSDIVAFSCTTPTFSHALGLARSLKRENSKIHIVFGGWHVSAVPEEALEHPEIDQIVIGEGEESFLDILNGNRNRVLRGRAVSDLDYLPFPDRELIRNHREIDLCCQIAKERITSFQSNRGCPFRCVFCAERVITGKFHRKDNPIRSRSPNNLLDEVVSVSERYKLDKFKFVDSTWNVTTERVISFCKEKISQGFDLPFECNIHAALTNQEMFEWMARANCHQINVGVESGSPAIMAKNRKGISCDKVEKVFKWARGVGIERRAFFQIGMIDETDEDIEMTEAFAEKIQPDVFGVTITCPYPGTDYYDREKFADVNWAKTDEYINDFWSTKYLTNQELKNWQQRLCNRFKDKMAWHNKLLINEEAIEI